MLFYILQLHLIVVNIGNYIIFNELLCKNYANQPFCTLQQNDVYLCHFCDFFNGITLKFS